MYQIGQEVACNSSHHDDVSVCTRRWLHYSFEGNVVSRAPSLSVEKQHRVKRQTRSEGKVLRIYPRASLLSTEKKKNMPEQAYSSPPSPIAQDSSFQTFVTMTHSGKSIFIWQSGIFYVSACQLCMYVCSMYVSMFPSIYPFIQPPTHSSIHPFVYTYKITDANKKMMPNGNVNPQEQMK